MAKLYTKNTWADEVLAGDERYNILDDNGDPIESTVQIELATAVAQAGTAVDAARMNNIEDGIDAIDDRLDDLETFVDGSVIDYSAASTVSGWSSFTNKEIICTKVGKLANVAFRISGTSDSTSCLFTVPWAAAAYQGGINVAAGYIVDNGVTLTTPGRVTITSGNNVVQIRKDMASGAFTASGTKTVYGTISYFVD